MVAYSRDQLIALDHPDLHVRRDVRKAIFGHALWLPQSQRDWNFRRRHERDANNVNNPPADHKHAVRADRSFHCGLLNARSIGNKSTTINSTIVERKLDMLLLTESWHTSHDDIALRRCVPAGFTYVDAPRPSDGSRQNHGGVAAIIADRVTYAVSSPLHVSLLLSSPSVSP